jgi:hypothetical protein
MGPLWPLTQCMDLEKGVFETGTEFEIRATEASIFNNEDDAMKTALVSRAPTMRELTMARRRRPAPGLSAMQMWPAEPGSISITILKLEAYRLNLSLV